MSLTNLGTKQVQEKDRSFVFHPSTHLAKHSRGETPNRIWFRRKLFGKVIAA
ncbi:hypothetical protein ACFSQQ_39250 [Mesorhizobium kowhaii]|uniref:hypothetical protein n=1 Tax=Mesorhizobium kowhaii TaxID=1300272 RepID=UPI0035ECE9D5